MAKQIVKKNIHIVLPVFNPIDGWAENVISRFNELKSECRHLGKLSMIIVNDGSTSANMRTGCDYLRTNLPEIQWIEYKKNRGKGYALRKGVEAADSDFIVYTDIDFPYTNESVVAIIEKLVTGRYDAVIGSRDESYYSSLPASRRWISHFLKRLNAILLGLKISDTQGGLKGFTKAIKPVFLQTQIDRYLFDLEFIYLLSRMKNARILPVKVKLREGVEFSKVRVHILTGEFRNFLKVLFTIK